MRYPRLTLQPHHTAQELWQAYQHSTCAVERRRLQVVALLAEGKSKAEVQAITRYSHPRYLEIIHRYNAEGVAGLIDRRHQNQGAPPLLTAEELERLRQQVQQDYDQGRLWSGEAVQRWVNDTLHKQVHVSRAYDFLAAIGFSKQRPRPFHRQADPAAQEHFKKTHS